jgi:PPK2 family polyphosphate:nucleotide phosphotransferase
MDKYRVKPGRAANLAKVNADDISLFKPVKGVQDKDAAREQLRALNKRIEHLQELLYAEHKHKLLIVFQAMDTGGKDGAIRDVFEGVNPAGVRVASFKVPTQEELDHDYLWRIHKHTPGKGEMVIFNRSHYEDVLVVRVKNLVPEAVWRKRYEQIVAFEKQLAEEGTTILKFYLHISKDEQKKRLEARLADPEKHWKFSVGDLAERKLWAEYMAAYQDVINNTSTEHAPWYVVPANKKWYRNLVVAEVIVNTLEGLRMSYPKPKEDLSNVVVE